MVWKKPDDNPSHPEPAPAPPRPAAPPAEGRRAERATATVGPSIFIKGDLSGVETIILKQTVRMDLYPDASSGFLTGSDPPPVDPKKGPEKSHVVIETEGQFRFEVAKDLAHFASPAAKARPSIASLGSRQNRTLAER